jgi:uncharacterized membrane protein (UPF0127 family)
MKMYMVKNFIIGTFVVACAAVAAFFLARGYGALFTFPQSPALEESATPTLVIGGEHIRITIADTDELRTRGLGGRETLAHDEGMLFVFSFDARHAIWMKGMKFPIDILWLSEDGTIIDMRGNVSPDTYPAAFAPRSPARSVLELSAGFIRERSIAVGDRVELR